MNTNAPGEPERTAARIRSEVRRPGGLPV